MKRIPLFTGALFAATAAYAQVIPPDTAQRITSSIASPGASYDLGVSGADGSFSLIKVGGGARLTIDSSGNVTVPQNLTVGGAFSAGSFAGGSLTGGATGFTLNAGGTNQNITLTPSGTGSTLLNGNVGIGTNAPDARVNISAALTAVPVAGLLRIGGAYDYSGQTNNVMLSIAPGVVNVDSPTVAGGRFKIDASGNVGIGTATPTAGYKLDVAGNTKVQGSLTATTAALTGTTTSTSSTTGALTVTGGVGIGGTLNVATAIVENDLWVNGNIHVTSGNVLAATSTDAIRITSTFDSSSPTTGALIVAGGAGIAKNLNVGGTLDTAVLKIAGQVFNPSTFVQQSGGAISGGAGGLTINAGATNQSLVLDADGTGRVEVRDVFAITNVSGLQYLLMGNQDSTGANNPAILRSANGIFEFGRGNSWTGTGGTFTPNVTILNNGNVGIGQPNPARPLDVNGSARLANGSALEWGGTTASISGTSASNTLMFSTAGAERLRVDAAGNVGIGTLAPSNLLTLQGDGFAQGINHTTTSSFSGLGFYEGGILQGGLTALGSASGAVGGPNALQLWNFKNAPTVFGTNSAERMRIDAAGNVGIGTTTPGKKLEVIGEVVSRNSAAAGGQAFDFQAVPTGGTIWLNGSYDSANSGAGWARVMDFALSGNVGIGTGATAPAAKLEIVQAASPEIAKFGNPSSSNSYISVASQANSVGARFGNWGNYPAMMDSLGRRIIVNDTNNNLTDLFTGDALRLRIDASGNVGIGTATPYAKLDVVGTAHFGTGTNDLTGTTIGLTLQDTSAAPVALAVGRNPTNAAGLLWTGTGATGAATLYTVANAAPLTLAASAVNIATGPSGYAMTIDNAHNVGIGTTAPGAKLEVFGAAIITGNLQTHTTSDSSDPALSLGSTNSTSSGSLRFLTSQGNWFGLANVAGRFSLFREPVGSALTVGREELLTFVGNFDTAQFKGDVAAHGFDALNSPIKNVASPLAPTDAANKNYVDINTPFRWNIGAQQVVLKTITDKVGIGTLAPAAPFHVGNRNFDGEIARFAPWSETIPPSNQQIAGVTVGQRSYISLYNQNDSFHWEFSSQDEGGLGRENGFALRSNRDANGLTVERFSINAASSNLSSPSIFRFHNMGANNAWAMEIDGAQGMSLHATAKNTNGYFVYDSPGLYITQGGNVGIGTKVPGAYKLAVTGSIHANEIVVETGWSDYVFGDNYKLAPLSEVEEHIKEHKHLPGVPSAQEVAANGVNLGAMQATLLAKVEELTLHLIEQEKRIQKLEAENVALRTR